jgi:competence protein ComEC
MHRFLVLVLATLALTSCVKAEVIRPTAPLPELTVRNDVWRTHFIDIGQGLAVLLEFPCGAALIDTGGENDSHVDSDQALKTYLDAFFARRQDLRRTLDLLVLTHPHIDHTHGVSTVLENYKVTHAIDNGMDQGSGGAAQGELHDWVAHHPETKYQPIALADIADPKGLTGDVIDPIRCKDVDPTFHALWGRVAQDPGWPGMRYGKTPFQNANNHSVVMRVTFGQASALFTGDLEEPAIRDLLKRSAGLDVLNVDVYQVGHHGSINGTIPELVAAMTPEVAVFSMGPPIWHETWSGWKYGHPRREIVAMLEEGIHRKRKAVDVLDGIQGEHFETHHLEQAIYGTGWDGTVVIEADAEGRMRVVTAGRKAVTPGPMPSTPPRQPLGAGGGDGHGDEH